MQLDDRSYFVAHLVDVALLDEASDPIGREFVAWHQRLLPFARTLS